MLVQQSLLVVLDNDDEFHFPIDETETGHIVLYIYDGRLWVCKDTLQCPWADFDIGDVVVLLLFPHYNFLPLEIANDDLFDRLLDEFFSLPICKIEIFDDDDISSGRVGATYVY